MNVRKEIKEVPKTIMEEVETIEVSLTKEEATLLFFIIGSICARDAEKFVNYTKEMFHSYTEIPNDGVSISKMIIHPLYNSLQKELNLKMT